MKKNTRTKVERMINSTCTQCLPPLGEIRREKIEQRTNNEVGKKNDRELYISRDPQSTKIERRNNRESSTSKKGQRIMPDCEVRGRENKYTAGYRRGDGGGAD